MRLYDAHTHIKESNNKNLITISSFDHNTENFDPWKKTFSVGFHPWNLNPENDFKSLKKLAAHHNCLAVGECGLDKLRGPDLAFQKNVLLSHLEVSELVGKPVILHIVKSFNEIMEIISDFAPTQPMIIHGFRGSPQLTKQLLNNGFYLSVNYNYFLHRGLTFPDIPFERLLLETDTDEMGIKSN